jgi:hypothetical protein
MKKLATTAAAVASRSCAKMSHIRGVKLEKRIIVPIYCRPDGARGAHQYRPLGARATLRSHGLGRAAPINRRIPELYG